MVFSYSSFSIALKPIASSRNSSVAEFVDVSPLWSVCDKGIVDAGSRMTCFAVSPSSFTLLLRKSFHSGHEVDPFGHTLWKEWKQPYDSVQSSFTLEFILHSGKSYVSIWSGLNWSRNPRGYKNGCFRSIVAKHSSECDMSWTTRVWREQTLAWTLGDVLIHDWLTEATTHVLLHVLWSLPMIWRFLMKYYCKCLM